MHQTVNLIAIGTLLYFSSVGSSCFGQLATAKLKTATVTYGEIASDNSIINRGSFNDQSKEYRIEKENGAFYLLSDGKQQGWVFKSSVELVNSPESSELPKHQSKSSQGEKESTQSTHTTPRKLVRILKSNGFRPSVDWKKSKFEKGWIGIYHLTNADAPDHVLNEASLQIVGANSRKISKVVVEAEIYDRNHKETTINNTAACLKLLEAPLEVVEALRSEKTTKVGRWQITRRPHPQGGGYDIECARTYGTTPKGKAKSKPDVKPKAKAASNQASYIKQYRKTLNENGLNNRIITRLSGSGEKVTITVVDAWSSMSYNERYQAASTLYKLWAITASPKSPDAARISIVDQNGTEIGGSRVWAGSLIWVSD